MSRGHHFTISACLAWVLLAVVPGLLPYALFVRKGKQGLVGSLFPLVVGTALGEMQTNGSRVSLMRHKRGTCLGILTALSGYWHLVGTNTVSKKLGFLSFVILGWATPWLYWLFWLAEPEPQFDRMGIISLRKLAIMNRLGLRKSTNPPQHS